MAEIKKYLSNIKNAVFGKEVRGSIHDGIDAINKEVELTTKRQDALEKIHQQLIINAGDSNAEVVDARVDKSTGQSFATMGERLDAATEQFIKTDQRLNETNAQLSRKVNFEDARLNTTPLKLDDCDGEMLRAIQGGGESTFNILSIPKKGSVSKSKLDNYLSEVFVDEPTHIEWALNGIGADGLDILNNIRARTSFLTLSQGNIIKCTNENIQFMVYEYTDSNTFVSQLIQSWEDLTEFVIPRDNNYRLQCRFKDNKVITDADLITIKNSMAFYGLNQQIDGGKIKEGTIDKKSVNDDFLSLILEKISDDEVSIVGWINTNNEFAPSTNYRVSNFIPCDNLTKIYVRGYLGSDATTGVGMVNFYSSNVFSSFIKKDAISLNNQIDTIVEVPNDAKYVVFQRDIRYESEFSISKAEYLNIFGKNSVGVSSDMVLSYEILKNRIAISDVVKFTSASAGHTVIDEARGICYTSYLASRTNYGESREVIGLAVYPINQPFKAVNYIVAEANVPINGLTFSSVYEPNILLLDDRVRIYFIPTITSGDVEKSNCYMYRDFLKSTNEFSEVGQIMLNDGKPLNKQNVSEFIQSKNGTTDESSHPIINTCRFVKYNNKIYGSLTSSNQSPVIFESEDGVTYKLKGVISNPANYECQLEILNDKMYCILRNKSINNFFVSTDFGETFNDGVRVEFSDTRPQIMKYEDNLLIVHSFLDASISDNPYVQGRCNAKFLLGNGDDPNLYETKLVIKSKYGIVYYSLINNRGDVYMTFSNGELFFDENTNYGMKDVQQFCKIGKLEIGKEYSLSI